MISSQQEFLKIVELRRMIEFIKKYPMLSLGGGVGVIPRESYFVAQDLRELIINLLQSKHDNMLEDFSTKENIPKDLIILSNALADECRQLLDAGLRPLLPPDPDDIF